MALISDEGTQVVLQLTIFVLTKLLVKAKYMHRHCTPRNNKLWRTVNDINIVMYPAFGEAHTLHSHHQQLRKL